MYFIKKLSWVMPLFLLATSFATQCWATAVDNVKKSTIFSENINIDSNAMGLTQADVEQYKKIMSSPMGFFYRRGEANIFMVLSSEATTDDERMKYARMMLKAESEYDEKLGQWLRSYSMAAMERNGANPKIFDFSRRDQLVSQFQSQVKKSGFLKRMKLYVRSDGCSECVEKFKELKNRLDAGALDGVDIFFVGNANNKQAIGRWAHEQKIDPDSVKQTLITLNFDDGEGEGDVPYTQDRFVPYSN